jgi:hypothetical protein
MPKTIPTKSAGPLSYRAHGQVHGEVHKGPSKRTEARRLKSLRLKQARINRAVEKLTRGQANAI